MAAFLRPGERQSGAFGVSFDTDRDAAAASLPTFNHNEKLALQDQRRRLPVYQHRYIKLPLCDFQENIGVYTDLQLSCSNLQL